MNWQTVSIFISSTFKDMHSERDILVKKVFPELREKLLPYRIKLVDIDLRWGITEEQSENDKTIAFCLDSIEGCRPFFLGMLGERYGWIPEHDHEELNHKFPGLKLMEASSITAMEIIHGVLSQEEEIGHKNPKSLFKRLISASSTAKKSHALFFFRDPNFEKNMPAELLDIVKVESTEHDKKLKALKDKIRHFPNIRKPIENYPCHFKGLILDWDLIENEAPDEIRVSIQQVIYHNVILKEDYHKLSEESKQWLQGRSRILLDQLEEFAQMVKDELWSMFQEEFPELQKPPLPVNDHHLLEDDEQLRYKDEITHLFVGREKLMTKVKEHFNQHHQAIVIASSSGSGSSALMAKLVQNWEKDHPEGHAIVHFSDISLLPSHPHPLIRRLLRLLASIENQNIPQDIESEMVFSMLQSLLQKIDPNKQILIAIDGLDHLFKNQGLDLRWIPEILPENVSILLSISEDQPYSAQNFKQLTQLKAAIIQIPMLRKDERVGLIKQLPALSAKTMDEQHVQLLADHPASNLPLFLSIALEELRVFASFEQLEKRIHLFPQQTGKEGLELMYQQVLQRLEREIGKDEVSHPLSLLYCSATGLKEREIQDLCPNISKEHLAILWRELRTHISTKNGLLHFHHKSLKEAVSRQYLSSSEKKNLFHRNLIDYFLHLPDQHRKLEELLKHYHVCQEYVLMQTLLFNLQNFLELRKNSPELLAIWWDKSGIKEPIDMLHDMLCQQLDAYNEILDNEEGINLGFWAPISDSKEIILYNEAHDQNIHPILEAWQQEALIELIRLVNQYNVNSSAALSIRLKILAIFCQEYGPVHARSLEALAAALPFIFQQIDQESGMQYATKILLSSASYLPAHHPIYISLRMTIQKLLIVNDPNSDYRVYFKELMEAFSDKQSCDQLREDPRDVALRSVQMISQKAIVLTAYSQTLRLKGEIEEAEKYCEEALQYTERNLGPLHELSVQALNNLAMIRMENKGDFESGEKMLKETLDRADASIGKYSFLGLALLNNLSTSYGNSGRYSEGLSYYREALERKLIVLGELDSSTLHSRYNLAFCLSKIEAYEEAITECRKSYEGFKQIGNVNDAILMQIHLSNILEQSGDMDRSIAVFNEAHHQFETLSKDHQDWNTHYLLTTRLADLYEVNDQKDQAWEIYWGQLNELRDIEAAQQPLEHLFHKMKSKLSEQLQFLQKNNQSEEAIEIIKEIIRLHSSLYKEDHPHVLHWKSEYCEALIKLERYEEAEPMIRDVVSQLERVSGKEAPETRIAVTHLARVLHHLGKEEEASQIFTESIEAGAQRKMDTESICKQVIEENEKEFGEGHPKTLKALDETAEELLKENKVTAAIAYIQLAYKRTEQAYGPLAMETLKRAEKMAHILWRTENLLEAEPLMRRIAMAYEESLGLEAENTLNALDDLAKILGEMGEDSEAIKILEKSLSGKNTFLGPLDLSTLQSHAYLFHLYDKKEDRDSYNDHLHQLTEKLKKLCQADAMEALMDRYLKASVMVLEERIEKHASVIKQMQSEGRGEYLGDGDDEIRQTALGMAERDMDQEHPDGIQELEQFLAILKQLQPYDFVLEIWESFCSQIENLLEEGALVKMMPRYYYALWQLDWGLFGRSLENMQKVIINGNLRSYHTQVAQRIYLNLVADRVDTDNMWTMSQQISSDLMEEMGPDHPPLQFLKKQAASFFMIHKDYQKAAQLYIEILEQIPSKVEVYKHEILACLGEAWVYLGETEKGIQACQEAWDFFAQNEQYKSHFGHVACHLANVLAINDETDAQELWFFAIQNAHHLLNEVFENKDYEDTLNQSFKLNNLIYAAKKMKAYPTLINILSVSSILYKRMGQYSLMNERLKSILIHLNEVENQDETFNFVLRTWQETNQKEMLEKLNMITKKLED